MMNKNNVPYYIAGTLATFTLLASGVFAAAPYIGFLAPVAALSVGLPFIIGYAVFSVVTIALSYKAISKNKTISEKVKEIEDKDIQLADEKSKADKIISEKDLEIFRMKNELAAIKRINASQPGNVVEFDSINQQLTKRDFEVQTQEQAIISQAKGKFNSVGNKLKNIYDTMPSAEFAKDIKTASEKAFTSTKEAFISGRVTRIVKDGLKDVYGTSFEPVKSALNSFGSSLKNTCDTSIGSAKGTISSVGNKLKNVYDTMPSTESVRNRVPSLKTVGWIAGGTGLLAGATYIAANGGLGVTGNSSNAVGNSTNSTESGVSIPNSSSVCYRPTYQQIMQIQIDEASKKLADAEKFAENNFGMSEEDNTNNKNESQSVVSRILSIPRNLWGSISNLISGSNKDAHNHSEPQWSKDLHKSEDLEEIIDGGTLDNLFSPRVNNGINTSRQQSTLMDSVDLTKLTREVHPSAYSNSLPGVL